MSFRGKVVIVTGSSSGIGATTAIQFAKEGADVVITGRNESKLKKVYDQCAQYNINTLVVKADVSDDAQSKLIIDKTIEKFGKIDVLVNNAGFTILGSILDGNLMNAYDGIMPTNVRAVFYLTTLAAPHLIKTKGNIVNISSVAGLSVSAAKNIPYAISKAAVNHFTRGSAFELGPHEVRVNGICPGPVETDFLENGGVNIPWESFGQKTLLNRVSGSDEVADLILYLASDKARGITGSIVTIDNGYLLRS